MNKIALYTLAKREIVRTFKIINQVVWPPIISTFLYIFVFGLSLGSKIETINGIPYLQFLIPGLIIMQIIDGSYGESSASLFTMRFSNSIQELLVAPMSYFEMVFGFIIGSLFRALIIGNLILVITYFIIGTTIYSIPAYIFFIVMTSVCFSSIGLVVGLWGEKFDHMAILTTFFITPLVFFGGVFHSIRLLPENLQIYTLFNPIFYIIDGFRFSLTGKLDGSLLYSVLVLGLMTLIFLSFALYLFRKGYKLRI